MLQLIQDHVPQGLVAVLVQHVVVVEDHLDYVLRYQVLRLTLHALLVALELGTDVLWLDLQLLVHCLYVVRDLFALGEPLEDGRFDSLKPYV